MSWTAVRRWIDGESAVGGGSRRRGRSEDRAHGGSAMKVLSECHWSAPSPRGWVWSSTMYSGLSPYLGAKGGKLIGPNCLAKTTCCSGVMSWFRKKSTWCSKSASRTVFALRFGDRFAEVDAIDVRADRGRDGLDVQAAHEVTSDRTR